VTVEFEQPQRAADRSRSRVRSSDRSREALTVGLINNMPDSALVGTERQFSRVLTNAAAAAGVNVLIRLGSLPDVPRGSSAQQRINESYWPPDDLLTGELDALIVTGSEPRAPVLSDEPYWGAMGRLLSWAESSLVTSVWSCLAAHMAVQTLDGIKRRRAPRKISGVYDFHVRHPGESVSPDASRVRTPHSRWNGLSEDELIASGYRVITSSDSGEVDTFIRQDKSLLVFCQGHPEYLKDTLLREYRRDVNRYLNHERSEIPRPPAGYLSAAGQVIAAEFERCVLASQTRDDLREFPFNQLLNELCSDWFEDAATLYRKWLRCIADSKGLPR
jgi:homoserine O-succinyltransferase/O-acetyltransferase